VPRAKILFVGDTLLQTRDGSDPFTHVEEIWDKHDLIIINLENPLTELCQPRKVKASLLFSAPSVVKWLERFRDKIVVCLANNHILDCGDAGYKETLRHLSEAGIRHCPFDRPFSTTVSATKITIYALYRKIENDFQKSFNDLDATHEKFLPENEFPIAFCHWGDEYVLIPNSRAVKTAAKLRTMGFKAIVGHHSHSAQGMTIHPHGCVTAYSLGNFNFPDSLWLDPPGWLLPRLGYMLSLEAGSQPPVWARLYYVIDKFGSPVPLTLDSIDRYFKDIDELLANYLSFSTLHRHFCYLSHSSRLTLKSNFCYGWLPRIREGGSKQMLLFLLWAANYRQIAKYPFMMLKSDELWRRYSEFVEGWTDYLKSAPPELRKILDLQHTIEANTSRV